jgi:hypothetical protein
MANQRQSTKSTEVEQLELLPTRKPCAPVDRAYVLGLPSLRKVIRYSVSLADLEPKQVYGPLEMDKAIWSRIENGGMSFPADSLSKLAEETQNDAPLVWLAHQRGYELVPLKSELEQQLEAKDAELTEERRENALLRKLLLERR